MKKVLVINGAGVFAESKGELNNTLFKWAIDFFKNKEGYEVQFTDVNEGYDSDEEVKKIVWADFVIYHTSIWWFQLPWAFKKYFDDVFNSGHREGLYFSDGRRSANPTRNYGTGGLLQGTKYMVNTTWNAPIEAFTIEEEFFHLRSVDDGVMYGFHKMNEFVGMSRIDGIHLYDVIKNLNIGHVEKVYHEHLKKVSKLF